MSKGKARPGQGYRLAAGGGGGQGGNMMSQLQKLQEEMAKTQEKLADETVEVTVGGGMVKAVMTGNQKLLSITIAPDAVDPDDVEMLQDMVTAAVPGWLLPPPFPLAPWRFQRTVWREPGVTVAPAAWVATTSTTIWSAPLAS